MSVTGIGKRGKSVRKGISIIAVLALLVSLLPAVPAMAAPVAGVSAQASDNKAGASGVTYDISFTAPSGLGGGDEITVTFATGYTLGNINQNNTTITYQEEPYTPSYVSVSGTAVKIGVPAELMVAQNGEVKVSIPNVTNPQKAGNYSIAVRTTNDTAGTTTFTIVANVADKLALDAPSSAVANQVVPLKVTIQDWYGNPTTMDDSDLTVTFTVYEEKQEANTAKLYKDSAATQVLTDNKLVIAKGNTSGTAYLKDTEAESVTIAVYNDKALTNPSDVPITFKASGDLAKIAFTAVPAQNQITAGEAGSFTLQLQDAYGNPVAAGTDGVAVTLTASGANADTVTWGETGVTPDPNDNLKATGTITKGQSELTFTFSDTKASDKVTITATIADPALSDSAVFKIVPGTNDHFVVSVADAYPDPATPDAVEINSDQRAAVTIEVQDKHGNPVPQASDLEVSLSSTSDTDNAKFYPDATSETDITTVAISSGKSSVTVYYYDKLRPEDGVQKIITISASAGTVTGSAPVTLMGPRPEKFEIAGDDSVEVNLRLPLTIKLLDQYGQPYAVAEDTEVTLQDDANGEFYTSLIGGTSVTSVDIPAGKSEATVYYRPTTAGTNTVTVNAQVNVNEATSFSVKGTKSVSVRPAGQVANELSITAEPIKAGTTGAVTVKVTDQYGNPVAQSADLVVTLKANSPTGKFYDKAQGGTEISTVTIKQGESEATVYYYDTKAGTQTVSAGAPGLDPAEDTTITVVSAAPAEIAVEAGELVVNQRAEINFTIVDEFGNPVELDSALTLVLSSSSAIGRFEDESGKQITQVTIAAGANSATAYYKDGTAGEVTITAKTTGLEGSAKLKVQPVPAPDTTPPGDVVGLTICYAAGVGKFDVSFTAPEDPDFAGVEVSVAPVGTENWQEADITSDGDGLVVQVPKQLLLGKDRVQFKVVAVDSSDNESQGVVADNDGQGYPVLACHELTPGPDGWRTFSVPVQLAGGQKLLGDVINLSKVNIAWKYDAASQQWVQVTEENNILQPLEAVYVNLKSPALAAVRPEVAPTNPPVRNLFEGWNLVGFTKGDSIDNALYSVRARWSVAVSPAVNPNPWAVTPAGEADVETHYGYWVYMDAPGKLAGFSSTPLTVGTYPY